MSLTGELAVLTICQDFICVHRPRFDKAFECLVSVIVSEFVASHEVHKIIDRKVPHAIFISHAAQALIFGQFQGDFHLARVRKCSRIRAIVSLFFVDK